MSTKRTSVESSLREETTECSDSFETESNAKRTKLALVSDTTLQDLPIEMLEDILIKVIVMEVKGMKLAKCAWIKKADLVISKLEAVCSHWTCTLTTKSFRKKLHRILEGTAQESIRLEVLDRSCIRDYAWDVTTMKDEIFVLMRDAINVYERNDIIIVKDVIPLPEGNPLHVATCTLSNCVYVLRGKQPLLDSVLRITKDDDNQFNISEIISDLWLLNPTLSVTTTGDIVLSTQWKEKRAVIGIYNANGSLKHEIQISLEICRLRKIIPKPNGNLVLVSIERDQNKTKLTEIDLQGNTLRHYLSAVVGDTMVCQADNYGRLMITEEGQNPRMVILDSEFNLLEFSGPQLDPCYLHFLSKFHYDSERNEMMTICWAGSVTIFRFMDVFKVGFS